MRWEDRIGHRLRVKDLHVLQAVAEAGSMAKAAGHLALSQSAISKILSDLEALLGVQLLERNARGVELTKAGLVLVARGRVIFDELQQGMADIAQLDDPTRGEVRIGATEPMTSVVSEIIERLSSTHPGIRYEVEVSDTGTIVEALRERRLDVVITRWVEPLISDDLEAEVLFATPLAVMCARSHPLADRRGHTLSGLMGEAWTLSPPDTFLGRLVGAAFRREGLPLPPAVVQSVSIYMRLNLLSGGRFISVLPLTMLRHPMNRPWLVALDADLSESAGPIGALTLKARTEGGPLRLFKDAARKVAKGLAWAPTSSQAIPIVDPPIS